jgi:hypothetical protein
MHANQQLIAQTVLQGIMLLVQVEQLLVQNVLLAAQPVMQQGIVKIVLMIDILMQLLALVFNVHILALHAILQLTVCLVIWLTGMMGLGDALNVLVAV